MIVEHLSQLEDGPRDVGWGNGRSRRLLVEAHDLGYSITDTIVDAGTESVLRYRNHSEACYCIDGEGELVVGGRTIPLAPGTLYAPAPGEEHVLLARSTLRLVCVFLPALVGDERHHLSDDAPSGY